MRMVSFWPWRADDSSPASFEKALSAVAAKITTTQARLDKTRAASRRVRVLWTLYLSFAYLVYTIVLVLVVGWKNLGQWEWTGVAGGPVLIYATRYILTAFSNFRIESLETKLKDQQSERSKTIQKLKDATKYDSTQELLAKYGGVEGKPSGKDKTGKGHGEGEGEKGQHGKGPHPAGPGGVQRTGMPPPPTANIPRGPNSLPPNAGTPKGRIASQSGPPASGSPGPARGGFDPSAEFAPNAFGPGEQGPMPSIPNAQYASVQGGVGESHWYDRVMDLLLGEDETAAKNRIVLICQQCRLVNGQAPPGTRALSEIGMWKCMGCGSMNGEVDEGKRIMREVLEKKRAVTPSSSGEIVTDGESFVDAGEEEDTEEEEGKSVSADSTSEGKQQPESHRELRKRKGKGGKQ